MDPHEIELKLGVEDDASIRRLVLDPDPRLLAGFGAAGEPREVVVVDRYLDTAIGEGRLQAVAVRARLRERDGAVVLAVKRAGVEEQGVTTRVELEGPAAPGLDPTAWPDSEARRTLLGEAGSGPLMVVATLRQRRLQRDLRRGSTIVELSLDELEALDGDEVADRRVELEAELKAGPPEALGELGEALASLPGLGPPSGSKLAFALAAVARRGRLEDGARAITDGC